MKLFDDDEDLLDEDVVDLRSFAAMEPIMYVELFELPPQQQKGDPWILQQSEFLVIVFFFLFLHPLFIRKCLQSSY